jgi:hypothetical protein
MASRYDVFLCHNQADRPAVQELADRLCAEGLEPWLDKSDLRHVVCNRTKRAAQGHPLP